MRKIFTLCITLVLVAAMLAGCSSNSARENAGFVSSPGANDGSYWGGEAPAPVLPAEDVDYQEPKGESPAGDGLQRDVAQNVSVTELADQMGSKIIKSGFIALETMDFEGTTSEITRRVQQAGGFIASSNVQGWSRTYAEYKPMRTAKYKVRIPSNRFEQFMTDIGELGNVTRNESWGEDVSAKYFDTEARLKSLKTQEERLLTILSKAENLSDILELERELSSVRYEIENLTGTLRKYDNLAAYSTLEIEVEEVEEIIVDVKPVTIWDKIARAFKRSLENAANILENMLIFLIGSIPFLIMLGLFVLVIFGLLRLLSRKSGKNEPIHSLVQINQNSDENKGDQS